jgi:hypothetical protein
VNEAWPGRPWHHGGKFASGGKSGINLPRSKASQINMAIAVSHIEVVSLRCCESCCQPLRLSRTSYFLTFGFFLFIFTFNSADTPL